MVGPPEVRWGNFKEVSAWGVARKPNSFYSIVQYRYCTPVHCGIRQLNIHIQIFIFKPRKPNFLGIPSLSRFSRTTRPCRDCSSRVTSVPCVCAVLMCHDRRTCTWRHRTANPAKPSVAWPWAHAAPDRMYEWMSQYANRSTVTERSTGGPQL